MNTQPKQTAHTPTPWSVGGIRRARPNLMGVAFVNGGKTCVAKCDSLYGSEDGQAEANAAFIVRACNSHASFVAALEKAEAKLSGIARLAATRTFSSTNFQLNSITEEAQSGYEAARAALAAAKEGA